jgi:hypothetical protein
MPQLATAARKNPVRADVFRLLASILPNHMHISEMAVQRGTVVPESARKEFEECLRARELLAEDEHLTGRTVHELVEHIAPEKRS